MEVRIEYKNKDLEVVAVKDYQLTDYCYSLSQSLLSLLYMIEDYNKGLVGFKDLRHRVLNLAGEIRRLPQNIKKK